eukprot:scaffold8170_cov65-Phaeocystis_antarctica.AAC.3
MSGLSAARPRFTLVANQPACCSCSAFGSGGGGAASAELGVGQTTRPVALDGAVLDAVLDGGPGGSEGGGKPRQYRTREPHGGSTAEVVQVNFCPASSAYAASVSSGSDRAETPDSLEAEPVRTVW